MNDGTVKIGIEFEVDDSELNQVGSSVENSIKQPKKTIEQFAKETGQTVEQVKSQISSLAAEYQAAGMTVQNSFKQAYSDLGVMSDAAAKKQKKSLESVEQAANSAADGISVVSKATENASKKFSAADTKTESFGNTAKNLGKASEKAAEGLEDLTNEANQTSKKIDSANDSLENIEDSAKDSEKKIEDVAQSMDDLGSGAKKAAEEIADVAITQKRASDKTRDFGSAARSAELKTEKLTAALSKLSTVAGKTVVTSIGAATTGIETLAKIASTSLIAAGTGAAAGLTAIGSGLASLIGYGSTYNAEIEQLQTSLEVMTGSAEKAADIIERLRVMGAETPFETKDLAEVMQLLMNYGVSAKTVLDTMSMLGDIAQGDAEKLKGIAIAYGQMNSAGKVYLEDIKQMIERGFNPLSEIAETTGESMDSLYQRISDGALAVDEITDSIIRSTSEGGKYFESMIKQSQTMSGQISTLKDNFAELAGTIAGDTSTAITQTFLPSLSDAISSMDAAFRSGGFEGLAKEFGLFLGDATAQGLKQLPEFMHLGTELMTAVYSGFIQNSENIRSGLSEIISALPDFASDNISLIYSIGSVFAGAIFEGIENNADKFASSSLKIIDAMVGFFAVNAPKFKDAAAALLQAFTREMEADGGDIYKSIGNILSLIPEFIDENMKALLSGGAGFVKIIANIIEASIDGIAGIARENKGEISKAINEALDIIIESFDGIGEDFGEIAEIIIMILSSTLSKKSDQFAETAFDIVYALINFIKNNAPLMAEAAKSLISAFANEAENRNAFSALISAAFSIISYLAEGFSNNFGLIIEKAVEIFRLFGTELSKKENLQIIISAAAAMLTAIITGIGENLDNVLLAVIDIIESLGSGLSDEANMDALIKGGKAVFDAIIKGLLSEENILTILETAAKILSFISIGLINQVMTSENIQKMNEFATVLFTELLIQIITLDWASIGISIVEGIISGITGTDFELPDWVSKLGGGLISSTKNISPQFSDTGSAATAAAQHEIDTDYLVTALENANLLIRANAVPYALQTESTTNTQSSIINNYNLTVDGYSPKLTDADGEAIGQIVQNSIQKNNFGVW